MLILKIGLAAAARLGTRRRIRTVTPPPVMYKAGYLDHGGFGSRAAGESESKGGFNKFINLLY